MKSKKISLLLILFALFFISCGKKDEKKEIEIKGDVFIVTKGAENYKLGLIKVTAIPEDVIQPYINNKISQRKDLTDYESAETYFDDVYFPQGVTSATTDAEGKFTLKLPKPGRYAIAARAERNVINKTEEYYWLVWINADGRATKTIMLSNNNLTDSGSSDSLIQTR